MNNNRIATEQLELGLNGARRTTLPRRKPNRATRAAWWFARMRAAVDGALVWTPKPLPRPQQIWFAQ
jgi:hypothetical protein